MNLEKEFEDLKLPKKEFTKFKERVLNRYHKDYSFTMPKQNNSVVNYDVKEVKEIFDATPEINEDIIAEELRKTRAYKRMNKKGEGLNLLDIFENLWHKVEIAGLSLATMGVIGFFGFMFYETEDNYIKHKKSVIEYNKQSEIFQKTFNQKLYEYGDTDNDGIIPKKEETALALKILKEKGILLKENYGTFYGFPIPETLNGDFFSIEDLTKLVEEYKE